MDRHVRSGLAGALCALAGALAGAVVAMVGTQLLPEQTPPTAVERAMVAGKDVDLDELAAALESHILPGRLLLQVVLPVAFLVVGVVVALLAPAGAQAVALGASAALWGVLLRAPLSGYHDLQYAALYAGAASLGAWLSGVVLRRLGKARA